jgi:hypothetical protein
MHDPDAVQDDQRWGDAGADADDLFGWERVAVESLRQGLPVDVFADEVAGGTVPPVRTGREVCVVHGHKIGMNKAGRYADLPFATSLGGVVASAAEYLDRDRSREDLVGSSEYGRAAALTENSLQPVTSGEHGTDTYVR